MKFVLTFSLLSFAQILFGQGGMGNHGDPRILKLKKARIEAVNWLAKIELDSSLIQGDAQTSDLIKKFLIDNDGMLEALKKDVFDAPHKYDFDENGRLLTCAVTNIDDAAIGGRDAIRFSLTKCAPYLDQAGFSFAIKTLIHESVHHLVRTDRLMKFFGMATEAEAMAYRLSTLKFSEQDQSLEENFCDQIAESIERAYLKMIRDGVAHWRDISVDSKLGDRGFHSAIWTGRTGNATTSDSMLVWGGCKETPNAIYACAEYFNDGAIYSPSKDTWKKMKATNAPVARIHHSATWTGSSAQNPSQMIIWGGCNGGDGCTEDLNSGGIYDVANDQWEVIPIDANTPSVRRNHSAVWSGKYFMIFGGTFGTEKPGQQARAFADGGVYDPSTKKWAKIPAADIKPRSYHSAIWTGATGNPKTANKMLVWGGCDLEVYIYCNEYYNDGAFFDPETMQWSKAEFTNLAPRPRRHHTGVNLQDRKSFLVWGGETDGGRLLGDGAVLNLATMTWERISAGPGVRRLHSSVWTGDELLIFGGETIKQGGSEEKILERNFAAFSFLRSGSALGGWRSFNSEFVPLVVKHHSAIWAGDRMIVFGGQSGLTAFESIGSAFYPGDER